VKVTLNPGQASVRGEGLDGGALRRAVLEAGYQVK